jgi:hypothetical protein
LKPARGLVLVELAQTEETIPGGRILLTQNEREKMAAYQMQVIAVGQAAICENPKRCDRSHAEFTHRSGKLERAHMIPEALKPNAWVLIRPRSLIDAGTETKRYLVRQDDILAAFTNG